ncbi:gas vesicle accessory protein GvpU [Vibrio scophthalmi]|uniref:gas vesicle accessory protein GvpU n=1 Tax=Vibrio scophthalmi TaxID=45658 RepID=UPI003EBA7AC2
MFDNNSELPILDPIDGVDWYIQNMISLANHGIDVGITLTVGGTVMSGKLISGKKYFDLVTEQIESSLSDENFKKVFVSFLESNSARYQGSPSEMPATQNAYIHLMDAKIFDSQGNSIPTNEGLLWRGKLDSISGISIGTISPA